VRRSRNQFEDLSRAKSQRTQRGKAATKFWILDFGFWIEEKEPIQIITQ
jgi:hypothetical protein